MPHKFIIPAPQPRICLVSVRDHICWISVLSLSQILRFMSHCSFTYPACRFNQKKPQMPVARFGDPQTVDTVAAGSFSRRKAKIRSIYISFREPFKIAGFYDQRQRRMGLDPQKTAQFLYFLLLSFLRRQFLYPLVKPLDLRGLLVIGCHVLIQRLPI